MDHRTRCKTAQPFFCGGWRKLVFVALMLPAVAYPLDNGLCLTPPMGWNSWNWFHCGATFNEALIREIADAMVTNGMRDAGYQYVNLDDCWAQEHRDSKGGLAPNKSRFPNFKGMIDYVHSKGLKVGLYCDVGEYTCSGAMPGSLRYEQQDADSFVAWGIDYVKYDFCGGRDAKMNPVTAYSKIRDCLAKAVADAKARGNASARPIVLSICEWGVNKPWTWAAPVGNLWRIFLDIEIDWGRIREIIDTSAGLWPYSKPGAWNDPDMLQVGNGLTAKQDKIHFAFWCMLAAPLIAGNDLRTMTTATRDLLTNPELIAIDQDSLGQQGRRIRKSNGIEVWARKLKNGDYAVILFNDWANTSDITITWEQIASTFGDQQLKASTSLHLRDVINRKDLGKFTASYTAKAVPTQDVVMLRLSGAPTVIGQSYRSIVARAAKKAAAQVAIAGASASVDLTQDSRRWYTIRGQRCTGRRCGVRILAAERFMPDAR